MKPKKNAREKLFLKLDGRVLLIGERGGKETSCEVLDEEVILKCLVRAIEFGLVAMENKMPKGKKK